MALLLTPFAGKPADWLALFKAELPDLEVRVAPDVGNPDEIEYAAIAALPHGRLKTFKNLRIIASLLAGADVVRAGDPGGDQMMSEASLLHVLFHHRHMTAFRLAQQRCEWVSLPRTRASERRVGVMGLGTIGVAAARALAAQGFKVAGWVRHPRTEEGIEVFAGPDRLPAFLARSEIVVNLLPLTRETIGILNADSFAKLPKGAAVINLGRGGHVIEADLMAALDSDHLAGATLDVFPVEPLPKDNPLWRHPKITITPHAARRIDPRDLVPRICEAIRDQRAGKPLQHLVDPARGY
jgi:glyoxylate/hydroxypyruvate reductase A